MQWIQYFERITQIDVLLPNSFSLSLGFFQMHTWGFTNLYTSMY